MYLDTSIGRTHRVGSTNRDARIRFARDGKRNGVHRRHLHHAPLLWRAMRASPACEASYLSADAVARAGGIARVGPFQRHFTNKKSHARHMEHRLPCPRALSIPPSGGAAFPEKKAPCISSTTCALPGCSRRHKTLANTQNVLSLRLPEAYWTYPKQK